MSQKITNGLIISVSVCSTCYILVFLKRGIFSKFTPKSYKKQRFEGCVYQLWRKLVKSVINRECIYTGSKLYIEHILNSETITDRQMWVAPFN